VQARHLGRASAGPGRNRRIAFVRAGSLTWTARAPERAFSFAPRGPARRRRGVPRRSGLDPPPAVVV